MGSNVTYPGTSFPAPTPTNYAQQQEQQATGAWNQAGDWVNADRAEAGAAKNSYRATADTGLSNYNGANASPNLGAYSTSNLSGYNPNQMRQWMSSLTIKPNGGSGWQGSYQPTTASSAKIDGPTNLAGVDTAALKNYDPSAYGKEFAQGAYGDFSNSLKDNLRDYDTASVAAGRFRTGQYDVGKGQVVTRLGSDFSNRLAQAATEFSGQRLSALNAGTSADISKAGAMDTNALNLAEFNANLGQTANLQNSRNALDWGNLDVSRYGAETSRLGLERTGAEAMDQLGFQRASALDTMGFNRASAMDSASARQRETGLNAALDREKMYTNDYNTQADRAAGYLSASRQWATNDRQTQDARDALARLNDPYGLKGRPTGGMGYSAASYVDPNYKVSQAMGVPYRP